MTTDPVFEQALYELYIWEGFISDHPSDSGGFTFRGIARNRHPDWEGWEYVDRGEYEKASQLAKDFYYEKFYKQYVRLPLQLRKKAFNTAVLVGHRRAVKLLQKAVNRVLGTNLKVDGILGKITIGAIQGADSGGYTTKILASYRLELLRFLERLVQIRPQNKVFLDGWRLRALY